MDIVEQKIQEIKDYFINRVVNGDFLIGIIQNVKNSKLMRVSLIIDEKYIVETLVDEDKKTLSIITVSKENDIEGFKYFPVISGFNMTEVQQMVSYESCNNTNYNI